MLLNQLEDRRHDLMFAYPFIRTKLKQDRAAHIARSYCIESLIPRSSVLIDQCLSRDVIMAASETRIPAAPQGDASRRRWQSELGVASLISARRRRRRSRNPKLAAVRRTSFALLTFPGWLCCYDSDHLPCRPLGCGDRPQRYAADCPYHV